MRQCYFSERCYYCRMKNKMLEKQKYERIFAVLEERGDPIKSKEMSAYMKNQFPFLGIPKPVLMQLEKELLKSLRKEPYIDWDFIDYGWQKDYREAQYFVLDYLKIKSKKLSFDDLQCLKKLIVTKSWWDTVDAIDAFVGQLLLTFPMFMDEMLNWSLDENIWLRRVSINFQLAYKEKTNCQLLEKIILNNLGSKEFFINKAIGWALREYSKTSPQWVIAFLHEYAEHMSNLSVREAVKYL